LALIGEDGVMSLAITVHGSSVELRGVVDSETSPALRVELQDLINAAGPGAMLRLDLGAVTLLDSSGLSVLLGAHRRAAARDVELLLVALPSHVVRTLNITGLDGVLNVVR
jgi:anti-anti-sigma factor